MMIDYGKHSVVHIFDSLPKHLAFHRATHKTTTHYDNDVHNKFNKIFRIVLDMCEKEDL